MKCAHCGDPATSRLTYQGVTKPLCAQCANGVRDIVQISNMLNCVVGGHVFRGRPATLGEAQAAKARDIWAHGA